MARRFYTNGDGGTTFTASLTSVATGGTVASAAGFPASTPFTASIEYGTVNAEVVLVTNVSGNTVTMTRGYDGTTAVSHSGSPTIQSVAVKQDLDEANVHIQATAAHGTVGAVVGTTDAQTLTNKTLTSPTINTPTIANPTVTGTLAGASETLSGTLAVTGAATAASFAANGNGQVTGVLNVKQYANEAAAGTPTVGLVVYLTAPTSSGYTGGLYKGAGAIWVPVNFVNDTNTQQQLSFVPGGNLDTPAAGTATWITLGNVTVPVWSTKCRVVWSIAGYYQTTANPLNVSCGLKVGTAAGPTSRLPGSTVTTQSTVTYSDTITGLATGAQSVTIPATFSAGGPGVFRVDTSDRITASFDFQP